MLMLTPSNPQTPLISFIIAYHNLPVDMLIQCIDSITALSLSREEREIIVIDDGSDVFTSDSKTAGFLPQETWASGVLRGSIFRWLMPTIICFRLRMNNV